MKEENLLPILSQPTLTSTLQMKRRVR